MNETRKQALPVGTRIGVYEIRRIIGEGRFGITYQVWNQHLNAEMALKEYFPNDIVQRAADGLTVLTRSDRDERLFQLGLDKFLEDADKLARIEHPNLERVQNDLQIHGTIYLAMEYEDGIPLSRLVERSGAVLDEEQVKIIFLPIIEALGEVHKAGVIHGDINPGNILLRKSGESVLLDFASARLALATPLGLSLEAFTEGYAPVEQYDPQGQMGPWTDLYSLGATMYRCVTGNNPLSATDRLSELSQGKSDPQWPAVEAAASGYHEHFLKAIDWMLAIRPEDRPQSVDPLLKSLTAGSEGEAEEGGISSQKTDADFAKTKPTTPRKTRLYVPLVIFAGITTVLLIATGLWYSSRDRRADEILAAAESQRMASLGALEDETKVPQVAAGPDYGIAQKDGDAGPSVDDVVSEDDILRSDPQAQGADRLGGADDMVPDTSTLRAQGTDASDESLAPQNEIIAVDSGSAPESVESEAFPVDQEAEMATVDATTAARDSYEALQIEGEPGSEGIDQPLEESIPDARPSTASAALQALGESKRATQTTASDTISSYSPEAEAGSDPVIMQTQDVTVAGLPLTREDTPPQREIPPALSPSPVEQTMGSSTEDAAPTELSKAVAVEPLPENQEMGRLPLSEGESRLSEAQHQREQPVIDLEPAQATGPNQQDIAVTGIIASPEADHEDVEAKVSDMQGSMLSAVPATELNAQPESDRFPSPTQTGANEDIITQHMAAAEEDIAALRLSTPQGDNALEHYQAVLALDSEHSAAQEGVRRIIEVYVWLIDKAIEQDQLVAARVYLQRAEEIVPEAPDLQRARLHLSTLHSVDELEPTETVE